MNWKLLFLLFLSSFILQCKTTSVIEKPKASTDLEATGPTILTLILRAHQDRPILEIENMIRSNGWLKERHATKHIDIEEGSFVFSFIDKNDTVVKKEYVHSPLVQQHEVPDDNGEFKPVIVERETEILNLRINDDGSLRTLKVEVIKNGKPEFLQTLSIAGKDKN